MKHNLFLYIKWYCTLNGIARFRSTIPYLNKTSMYTMYNSIETKNIKKLMHIENLNELWILKKSTSNSHSPEEIALLVDPDVPLTILQFYLKFANTVFFLSEDKNMCRKEDILEKNYFYLSNQFKDVNFFLLNESLSKMVLEYITNPRDLEIIIKLSRNDSFLHKLTIVTCLIIICVCVLSLFYLICGIYASKNPIITEFELNRFKIVKYKEVKTSSSEMCLICFDIFSDEENIRVLGCKHYFHTECIDRWLCEQSSRCPYCRYTNKSYEKI